MRTYASGAKLSELSLVDEPVNEADKAPTPPTPITAGAVSPPAGPGKSADARDRFLADATVELVRGHVEQSLWERAIEIAAGDVAKAKGVYLRARATALRIEQRERQGTRTSRRAPATTHTEGHRAASASATPAAAAGEPRPSSPFKRRRVPLVAGALATVAVIAVLIATQPWGGSPKGREVAPAPAAAPIPSQPMKPASPVPVRQEISGEDLSAKVRDLREAGNWNVLVLYATEWTRKQPGNPEAWRELGQGYLRLRQYREALDATTRATQLAPSDQRAWQDLGQVNVELGDSDAALVAFARAVELNERDVASLVSIGALQDERGHLPEARTAFANALAISPGDVEALCGAEAVARKEGRAKDSEALRRSIVAAGRACRAVDGSEGAAARGASPRNAANVYR